jgi:hypothetical protein
MRRFWTDPAHSAARSPFFATDIHPALTSFADEVCAMIARLFLYVGALALIAILGVHFWAQLPQLVDNEGAPKASWSVADRSYPAFALSAFDAKGKSATYTILRHPEGGRKDIFSWAGMGDHPLAALEIYRMGDESGAALPPAADLALQMRAGGEMEAAGVIDSKFGTVALVRRTRTKDGTGACLGFFKGIDDPALRISGWTCQGDSLPARRSAVACMLDHLTLLTAGNEPKLAQLFAHAELQRRNSSGIGSAAAGDWITEAANPRLRGAL